MLRLATQQTFTSRGAFHLPNSFRVIRLERAKIFLSKWNVHPTLFNLHNPYMELFTCLALFMLRNAREKLGLVPKRTWNVTETEISVFPFRTEIQDNLFRRTVFFRNHSGWKIWKSPFHLQTDRNFRFLCVNGKRPKARFPYDRLCRKDRLCRFKFLVLGRLYGNALQDDRDNPYRRNYRDDPVVRDRLEFYPCYRDDFTKRQRRSLRQRRSYGNRALETNINTDYYLVFHSR